MSVSGQAGSPRPTPGRRVPLFVPVAFSEEEALHLLGAARTIIHSGVAFGEGRAKEMAPLAQAMIRLAEATDKARANHDSESEPPHAS